MKTLTGSTGATVSYSVAGNGPPLVLVHGAFSDHDTNWAFVAPLFRQLFTVYAVARRGRGANGGDRGPYAGRRGPGRGRRGPRDWCAGLSARTLVRRSLLVAGSASSSPIASRNSCSTNRPGRTGEARRDGGARDAGARRRLGSVCLCVLREHAARADRRARPAARLRAVAPDCRRRPATLGDLRRSRVPIRPDGASRNSTSRCCCRSDPRVRETSTRPTRSQRFCRACRSTPSPGRRTRG